MATRFVATDECDASEEFKKAYVEASKLSNKILTFALNFIPYFYSQVFRLKGQYKKSYNVMDV